MGGRGGASKLSGGGGSKGLGTLVHTYADGTKSYEKKNATLPNDEATEWAQAMSNYVKNEAARQLNASSYDLDVDIDNMTVTRWHNTDPSISGLPQKEFYRISVVGTKVTSVKPTGKKKTRYKDAEITLTAAGGKW